MENLLSVMNKLMHVFAEINIPEIELPRIVVVGAQSSGKSSVIEAIVQRDFLPRGSGIVTRCPLVLHLVKESNTQSSDWGEFDHLPKKRFDDFQQIRREIETFTAKKAGSGKCVSSECIFLTIHSAKVVNLILVDLPGLTKVPVMGQPIDIEKQIFELVQKFIASPRTIILAVSPANDDLANSESLKLARAYDERGARTLGVITKLDIMNPGTDAADVLLNRVVPLRLGYIGLCLRTQKDINENKDVLSSLKDEAQFFANHPAYQSFRQRLGTPYLCETLSSLLLQHVQDNFPLINAQIMSLLQKNEAELMKYGLSIKEDSYGQSLLNILSKFSQTYGSQLDGEVTTQTTSNFSLVNSFINDLGLHGGARVSKVFRENFPMDLSFEECNLGLSEGELQVQMKNALGIQSSLFVPEKCFFQLATHQIERLRSPSQKCLELVHHECIKVVHASLQAVAATNAAEGSLERFPKLKGRLIDETTRLLGEMKADAAKMIDALINIEEGYINVKHPDFNPMNIAYEVMRKHQQQQQPQQQQPQQQQPQQQQQQYQSSPPQLPLGPPPPLMSYPQMPMSLPPHQPPPQSSYQQQHHQQQQQTQQQQQQAQQQQQQLLQMQMQRAESSMMVLFTTNESMKADMIRALVTSYYNIVRRIIVDAVPKSVMHFLVNKSKKVLQDELIRRIYKPELFRDLLAEDPSTATKREQCLARQKGLRAAALILDDISSSPQFTQLDSRPRLELGGAMGGGGEGAKGEFGGAGVEQGPLGSLSLGGGKRNALYQSSSSSSSSSTSSSSSSSSTSSSSSLSFAIPGPPSKKN